MRKNKVTITKKLQDELGDILTAIKVGMAATFRDELTKETQKSLELFYSDYAPKAGNIDTSYPWEFHKPEGVPLRYNRHYTNILQKSYIKYYKNPHNSIIRGGVQLSSSKMSDIYDDLPKELIFSSVYQGIHGISQNQLIPQMDPNPMELILTKRDDMVDKLGVYAVRTYNKKVASKRYRSLQCNKGGVRIGR